MLPLQPRRSLLCGALTGLLCAAAPWAAQAQTAGLLACLILPERVADLGSSVVGVVEEVTVERGALVKQGQVLVRLRADVERANTSVARSRADSEGELRAATAGRDLAQQKLDRTRSLAAQNFISTQAVEQAEAEFRVARERMQQARDQQGTSVREVSSAQAHLAQRVVRSPFDGVVTERFVHPGERVEDKPLLKVASLGQLRVEVVVATPLFGSLLVGQELNVQPELTGAAARAARIVQIDRVLEPASNTFRMRLELPNDDGRLPAGLRCKAFIGKPADPAKAPERLHRDLSAAAAGLQARPAGAALITR